MKKTTKRIFKYPIEITDNQMVLIPKGTEILSVFVQHNQPVVYAMIDDEEQITEYVEFKIIGTGNPFDDMTGTGFIFLGTIGTHNNNLMWHVFYND